MKYKLIIDKDADEEIIAKVHAPSSLTEQIENLVCSFSGAESIMGYNDDEMKKLLFSEIECITVVDKKVIAVDTKGKRYRIQERLRDLENILPSYFIRINKSTLASNTALSDLMLCSTAVWMQYSDAVIVSMFQGVAFHK